MCPGGECPEKSKCYRHTAVVNEFRQAFFIAPPAQIQKPNGTTECEMFWNNEGRSQVNG